MKIPFVKPSTRSFFEEARKLPSYTFLDLLHGYIYARWPYFYIGVGKGKHPATKYMAPLENFIDGLITKKKKEEVPEETIGFADTYHGKAVPLEDETIGLMGSNLGISSLDMIGRLNWEANDLGLDSIEVGAALGVAAEAGPGGWSRCNGEKI